MHVEYHKWWSPSLNQDFELKIYGNFGRPVLVFPTSQNRFYELEEKGGIDALSSLINAGKIKVFAIDGRDSEIWFSQKHAYDKASRAYDYLNCIANEVVPFIRNCQNDQNAKVIVTGASWGAYYAAMFGLRYPQLVETAICLSGLYSVLSLCPGGYYDDRVRDHDPFGYLEAVDEGKLNELRNTFFIMCIGQGPWEGEFIDGSWELANKLKARGVPVKHEMWGHDVAHDWPWWNIQLPYFIETLV